MPKYQEFGTICATSSGATASLNISKCECSSMVELQLPKLLTRVRFPSLAPLHKKFSPRILNIFTEHVGCKNKRSLKKCSLASSCCKQNRVQTYEMNKYEPDCFLNKILNVRRERRPCICQKRELLLQTNTVRNAPIIHKGVRSLLRTVL